jgi:hypothetical protein
MDKYYQKIFYFMLLTLGYTVILGFVSGYIRDNYKSMTYINGIPFNIYLFLMGLIVMFFTLIAYLFFPKTKKRGNL